MSALVPRLAEHAYWVRREFLKDHQEVMSLPVAWEQLPDCDKAAWCEAVQEVLNRAG